MENPPLLYGKDINTGNIYQLKALGNVLLTNHSSTPIGSINQYAGNGILSPLPAGWMICNGAAISRTTYANLYAVIGTLYGVGDNSTTFNLPNLQGRVPVGLNSGTFNILGKTGGAETHTLTVNEIPSHNHTYRDAYFAEVGGTVGPATFAGSSSGNDFDNRLFVVNNNSENTGSGASHNNLQPYIVLDYIIYTGYNILITPINNVTIPNAGIDDLVDVSITTPSDGQLLKYNSSGLNWTNSTIPIGGSNNGYITGGFPTVVPANATTGNLFTVPIAGNYVINVCASAYMSSGTVININIWINGINTGRELRLYANELNSHKTLVPISFRYALNAGNNYLYLRMIAGSSDGNDFASFNWIYSPVIV